MTIQEAIHSGKPFTRDDSDRIYKIIDEYVYSKHKDRLYKDASCDHFTIKDVIATNWHLVDENVYQNKTETLTKS